MTHDLAAVERAAASFINLAFTTLSSTRALHLLNSFLARYGQLRLQSPLSLLLNTNYADYPFSLPAFRGNAESHLRREYLAALETIRTPYFLNLHYRRTAHSMNLGRTAAGVLLLNFLITNLQKYDPTPSSSISRKL